MCPSSERKVLRLPRIRCNLENDDAAVEEGMREADEFRKEGAEIYKEV